MQGIAFAKLKENENCVMKSNLRRNGIKWYNQQGQLAVQNPFWWGSVSYYIPPQCGHGNRNLSSLVTPSTLLTISYLQNTKDFIYRRWKGWIFCWKPQSLWCVLLSSFYCCVAPLQPWLLLVLIFTGNPKVNYWCITQEYDKCIIYRGSWEAWQTYCHI